MSHYCECRRPAILRTTRTAKRASVRRWGWRKGHDTCWACLRALIARVTGKRPEQNPILSQEIDS